MYVYLWYRSIESWKHEILSWIWNWIVKECRFVVVVVALSISMVLDEWMSGLEISMYNSSNRSLS